MIITTEDLDRMLGESTAFPALLDSIGTYMGTHEVLPDGRWAVTSLGGYTDDVGSGAALPPDFLGFHVYEDHGLLTNRGVSELVAVAARAMDLNVTQRLAALLAVAPGSIDEVTIRYWIGERESKVWIEDGDLHWLAKQPIGLAVGVLAGVPA